MDCTKIEIQSRATGWILFKFSRNSTAFVDEIIEKRLNEKRINEKLQQYFYSE